MYSEKDRQMAKEIMIALIQAGGQNSHTGFFAKPDQEPVRTDAFETVWKRILKTVSADNQ